MRKMLKSVALLLLLSFLMSTVAVLPLSAESSSEAVASSKKTQKVVAVVYDDSGSMKDKVVNNGKTTSSTRADYALYSIKMLMSLLGEGDVLQIVPMNKAAKSYTLVGDGRQKQITDIVATQIFTPSGGTPLSSVDSALSQLCNAGLKDAKNLTTQDENKDFWLFVLTDGAFDVASTSGTLSKQLKNRISNYPSLKTMYLAFSSSAVDLRGTDFESEMSTAYMAAGGDDLVKVMQDIANQLSGRYNYTDYTLNGDTLTVNFSNSVFAIKNLSILALNCGAEITSVTYQGKDIKASSLVQECKIDPVGISGIDSGYSGLIEGVPYFSGGTMTIKFSKAVQKEYLSIFAEPAIILSPTFKVTDSTGKLVSVNADYITGGKVNKGQTLKVGYECTTIDGKKIDLASTFNSKVSASVTYAGTNKPIPDGSTETDITLVEGPNNITITVSVLDVNYKMYTSVNCNILADQTSYKVTAEHKADEFAKNGNSIASYKVYVNNTEKTPQQLKADGFSWYVEVTAPNGDITKIDNPEMNGKIACEIESTPGLSGEYNVYFRVVSTLGWRMDEAKYNFAFDMGSIDIKTSSPETLPKGTKEANAVFTVHYGDSQFSKADLNNYDIKLTVVSHDGTESDATPTIDDSGRISTKVNINPNIYGAYKVKIEVKSKSGGEPREYTHTFKVYPSSVNITGQHEDSFKSGETKTSATYKIKVDGVQLTKDQLNQYKWSLKTYLPGGETEYGNTVNVDPDGTIHLEFDVAGAPFGAYESKVELVFSDDYIESYNNFVKNYPSDVTMNVLGSQKLSISQYQMTINDKPVEFELFSDGGLPLVFNNGITAYKVLADGKDVTQYAIVKGNVLSYAPHADHFGGPLPLGSYKVEVRVNSAELPALSASASTDFEVKETLFQIKSLDTTNKTVERFKLKDMNVAIHFQVLRDGVPLPLDELTAAYEAGEINVVDKKGSFTWEFWLPTGRELAVKEVNGQPVLEFKVTRDIALLGLDKVMGMFYFTGDKPISLTYNGVTGIDSIRIERGAVGTYLLIWFIIFFITHLVLFAIGFFNGKCKNLPSGAFISVSLMGLDAAEAEFEINRSGMVNLSFQDKWMWHLGRLLLYGCFKQKKLWYHQPGFMYIDYGATLCYNEDGELGLVIKNEDVFKVDFDPNVPAGVATRDFMNKVSEWDGRSAMPEMEQKVSIHMFKRCFRVPRGTPSIQPTEFLPSYTRQYAEYNARNNRIYSVMMFVEKY